MSSKNRYRLFDWIKSRKSIKSYQEWRSDSTTDVILYGMQSLNEAKLIAPSPGDGKIDPLEAVQLNAFRAGRQSVIDMLLHLDDYVDMQSNEEDLDEDLIVRHLMESERYSEVDARRIVEQDIIGEV